MISFYKRIIRGLSGGIYFTFKNQLTTAQLNVPNITEENQKDSRPNLVGAFTRNLKSSSDTFKVQPKNLFHGI